MASELKTSQPGALLPDLPHKVHGIKSLSPWTVQCDDCLTCWSGEHLIFVAKAATFNQRASVRLRLCESCWNARGWFDEYHGWCFYPERAKTNGEDDD